MDNKQTLEDMGFPADKVEQALQVSEGNLERATDWLLANTGDDGSELASVKEQEGQVEMPQNEEAAPSCPAGPEANEGCVEETKEEEGSEEGGQQIAKSIKCDECGKLFRTPDEVEFHAVKSGHSAFSESTEEKKPLTEEEKKQKLKEIEEKLRQRRKQKEHQETREAIEREKKRIQMSKEISESKRKFHEEEMKRIAEERRREKLEEKLARQKIKEQIERDKQARQEKFASQTAAPPPVVSTTSAAPASTQKKEYDTTRLQIRLPTGPPLVQEFKAKEPLSAVRLWVEMNRTDGAVGNFSMATTFPKKVFGEEDMEKPLYALGLVPSAVLVVTNQ